MNAIASPSGKAPVVYPESDDLPIANNSIQFRWITTIAGAAGNLHWYPVEGNNLSALMSLSFSVDQKAIAVVEPERNSK